MPMLRVCYCCVFDSSVCACVHQLPQHKLHEVVVDALTLVCHYCYYCLLLLPQQPANASEAVRQGQER
jgi:hypothetical protein